MPATTRHATTLNRKAIPTSSRKATAMAITKAIPTSSRKATAMATRKTSDSQKNTPALPSSLRYRDQATVDKMVLLRLQALDICMSILRTSQHGASDSDKGKWTIKLDRVWEKIDGFALEKNLYYHPDDIQSAIRSLVQDYCGETELHEDSVGCPIDGFEGFMWQRIVGAHK